MSFSRRRKPDLAIDLGTANMRMAVRGEGVVFDEPSLCCYQDRDGRSHFVAAGKAVLPMLDRLPRTLSIRRPLARGVLQDIDATSSLLAHGVRTVSGKRRRARPDALIGIPADATKAEASALRTAAADAGLGRIELIREPFAAAMGAGLPVREARASMIIECGAGTTEVAVFSINGHCRSRSVRLGGLSLDEALTEYLHTKHHFLIGRSTAEWLKRALSSQQSGETVPIKGRDLRTGLPATLTLASAEFEPVLAKHFARFADATRLVLGEISADLAADLLTESVVATGGGICASHLTEALTRECGVPLTVADNAEGCVARGLEQLMEG